MRVLPGAGHKTKQTPRVYTKLASECADLVLLEAFPIKRRVSSNYVILISIDPLRPDLPAGKLIPNRQTGEKSLFDLREDPWRTRGCGPAIPGGHGVSQ